MLARGRMVAERNDILKIESNPNASPGPFPSGSDAGNLNLYDSGLVRVDGEALAGLPGISWSGDGSIKDRNAAAAGSSEIAPASCLNSGSRQPAPAGIGEFPMRPVCFAAAAAAGRRLES